MSENPLASLSDDSRFVAELMNRASIVRSTVIVWSDSPFTGNAEGEVFFSNGIRLRMREELDFDAALIASYGYEIYRGVERLFGMTISPIPRSFAGLDFSASQARPAGHSSPPRPAPAMRFNRPKLPGLIEEIESL